MATLVSLPVLPARAAAVAPAAANTATLSLYWLRVDPSHPATLYVGGAARSTDGGHTWKQLPITDAIRGTIRADYRITGPTWFHSVQDQSAPTIFSGLLPISALALPAFVGNANYVVTQRKAFAVANLRVGLEGDTWSLTGFANNLFDRKYLNEVIPAIEFGGSFISPGGRRVIGVEAGFKF